LLIALESDERIRMVPTRMVRLLGLRHERIGTLDRELVDFIDAKFRPLYIERAGTFELPADRRLAFVEAASGLRALVRKVELKLLAEQDKLNN
jgi:hypothetical protein